MAGGGGNRFWPVTRETRPKQFIEAAGQTLLRAAYDRCKGIVPDENILVITLEKYKALVEELIPELPAENLLVEPYGRKTGPCIAYATYTLLRRDPDAVMAVTPCDLIIKGRALFRKNIQQALDYAAKHPVLMTMGIVPSRPDPGYGYIQVQGGRSAIEPCQPVPVKTFMEKPSVDLAKVFVKSGEFLWNAGFFIWQADVIRTEMEDYMPQITCQFDGWQGALGTPAESAFIEKAYSGCDKLSIDYGVMEKTAKAWVWPAEFGWSDVDSWETLWSNFPTHDSGENVVSSASDIRMNEVTNSVIVGQKNCKLLAIKGLKDYIVVDTEDVLLICPRDDEQYSDFISGLSRR